MDQRERVQQLSEDHAEDLRSLAIDLGEHRQWDLSLPVAVIDARSERRRFHISAVGTIGNVVRVSTTIDHPLMQKLFELIQTRSDDSALELMLSNADYGDEFAAVFEIPRRETQWSADLECLGCSVIRCQVQRSVRRPGACRRGTAAGRSP